MEYRNGILRIIAWTKLVISLNRVTKLLENVNISKVSGHDHMPDKLL